MPRRVQHVALLIASSLAFAACATETSPADAQPSARDAALPAHDDAATANDDAAPAHDDAMANDDAGPAAEDAAPANSDAAPAHDDAAQALPDAGPATMDAAAPPTMTIDSPSITAGGTIPPLHTCTGRDIQPALNFGGVPAGAQSLALVLIDDSIDFVHWIAIDMPPSTTSLAEGASDNRTLPAGTREIRAYGLTYRGPCPPSGTHTYTFRLYALSVPMTNYAWPGGAYRDANLVAAFGANTLAEARLTATYTR